MKDSWVTLTMTVKDQKNRTIHQEILDGERSAIMEVVAAMASGCDEGEVKKEEETRNKN
jgi:hypothetical protein